MFLNRIALNFSLEKVNFCKALLHCPFQEINVFKVYSIAFFHNLTQLMRIALLIALRIALRIAFINTFAFEKQLSDSPSRGVDDSPIL
jgi:hypothetical protein